MELNQERCSRSCGVKCELLLKKNVISSYYGLSALNELKRWFF